MAHRLVTRSAMPTDLQHEGLQAKILSPIDDPHANCFISVQMDCIRRVSKTIPLSQTLPHPRRHGGDTP